MNETRCYLAKYCPDIKRFEPRNIGIILWSGGQVFARFLGETDSGRLRPPASMPKNCRSAYKQWVAYWRIQMDRKVIRRRDGSAVPKDSPQFLEALRESSKEQFMLSYSNTLPVALSGVELQEAAEEFFSELVEQRPEHTGRASTAESERLRESCTFMFEKSGLRNNPNFHSNFHTPCAINQAWQDFTFHYGIGNGKPDAVFHRVLIARPSSVHDAAFMFQWSTSSPMLELPKKRCAAIFAATAEQKSDVQIANAIGLLSEFAVPVNVLDEPDVAIESIKTIAQSD